MTATTIPPAEMTTDENPFLPENVLNPFPLYRRMRDLGPVVWLSSVGVWGVFHDETCREVVTDWERFGSCGGGGVANYYREKPWREPSVVFEVDPPDHTRTRRVLSRILSPLAVRALSEQVQREADAALSRVLPLGEFDVVNDLVKPFVMKIVPDAVGLPAEGRENLLVYNHYLLKGRGFFRHHPWSAEEHEEAARVVDWVNDVCRRESVSPDGFGARIYADADAGEISHYEAGMLIRSFLSAGTDTTIGSICNTLRFLLDDREQWEKLHADPGLARNAYEESLRFKSPAQIIARNTMSAMEYRGAHMGQHDKVIAFVGSANRDPARWEDPDRFVADRNVVGHLGLGTGIHGCVGQMIARTEAATLLQMLAERVASLELPENGYGVLPSGRGLGHLRVRARMR